MIICLAKTRAGLFGFNEVVHANHCTGTPKGAYREGALCLGVQQELDDIPLAYPFAIEAHQRVCGEDYLFIVVVDGLQRGEFPLCIVFGQDVKYWLDG